MNIRSITGFLPSADPIRDSDLRALRDLVAAARAALPIQTARVALQFPATLTPDALTRDARDLARACQSNAIDYASLGALDGEHPLVAALPAALCATENIFASAHIASRDAGINFTAITNAARVIRQLADSTQDGFGNLRFAALANVPPHSPFFPAAYHDGSARAFAFATEAASLAVDAFNRAHNLDDARANLVGAIERESETLTRVANDLAARFDFRFAGIDFSLAPYPDESRSVGAAIEKLIGAQFGEHGTLFATAFLTDCINRAKFPRTGFSGVMLPVLEDTALAARSARFTLDSLLLYSAVCGTGLDTIPLPGDTSVDALAAILLDLATLAVKLNKPLTARLMPIPGLRAGDETRFNFEYFANARVMNVNASAVKIFGTDKQVKFKTDDRRRMTDA
ncbi:MAG: DUF711 family protein [Chloroflexi bacterium]|nr:DUF711 family protein [Chloroflexota bacterium]